MLYSIKYFLSGRKVFFNKGIFSAKNLISCLLAQKGAIRHVNSLPFISRWGLCFKRKTQTHTETSFYIHTTASNVKCTALSWGGVLHWINTAPLSSAQLGSTWRNGVTKISDPSTFSRTAQFQPLSFFFFTPCPSQSHITALNRPGISLRWAEITKKWLDQV